MPCCRFLRTRRARPFVGTATTCGTDLSQQVLRDLESSGADAQRRLVRKGEEMIASGCSERAQNKSLPWLAGFQRNDAALFGLVLNKEFRELFLQRLDLRQVADLNVRIVGIAIPVILVIVLSTVERLER